MFEEEFYFDGQHNSGIYNSGNLSNYNYCYQNPIKYIDPNGKQAWAYAILGFIQTDIMVPEPTDAAVPKWIGYGIASAVAGVAIGLKAREIVKPIDIPLVIPKAITKPKEDTETTVNFYRQMSKEEYAQTGGYLMDSNKSGEAKGGHVRKDLNYIKNAAFLRKKAGTDVLIKYTVDAKAAAVFDSTPFQTTAGPNNDSATFNNARKAGIWYKKHEGLNDTQGTYGFPGSSTTIFNGALVTPPEIVK